MDPVFVQRDTAPPQDPAPLPAGAQAVAITAYCATAVTAIFCPFLIPLALAPLGIMQLLKERRAKQR